MTEHVRMTIADAAERRFTATQEASPVHGRGPDPNWAYTDRAGHVHGYAAEAPHYPTLERHTEHVPCADPECGCDGYDDEYYACPGCGERIRPGSRPETHYLHGRTTYAIDGVAVTKAVFDAELARAQEPKP